jgi:hypothetical protein
MYLAQCILAGKWAVSSKHSEGEDDDNDDRDDSNESTLQNFLPESLLPEAIHSLNVLELH